jgi:beta-1,4-mannosyltransferase
MFGCGLPVAAKGFPALPELVKDGINGTIFHTQEELATQVNNLISTNGFTVLRILRSILAIR